MNKVKIALVIFSLLLSVQKWYNPSQKDEEPLSRTPVSLTLVLNQKEENRKKQKDKKERRKPKKEDKNEEKTPKSNEKVK